MTFDSKGNFDMERSDIGFAKITGKIRRFLEEQNGTGLKCCKTTDAEIIPENISVRTS